MKILITTLVPVSLTQTDAPRAVRAIPDFVAAGHEVYLAAPLASGADQIRKAWKVKGVLPLFRTLPVSWLPLTLNAYRLAYWGKRWMPDLYLSVEASAATLAHSGRGAVGGYGVSVMVLPFLRSQFSGGLDAWLERRAIVECDRLVMDSPDLLDTVVSRYGARRADSTLLPGEETEPFVTLCEAFLNEPPGNQEPLLI